MIGTFPVFPTLAVTGNPPFLQENTVTHQPQAQVYWIDVSLKKIQRVPTGWEGCEPGIKKCRENKNEAIRMCFFF